MGKSGEKRDFASFFFKKKKNTKVKVVTELQHFPPGRGYRNTPFLKGLLYSNMLLTQRGIASFVTQFCIFISLPEAKSL